MRAIIFVCLLAAVAHAEVPGYVRTYQRALGNCQPSCYAREPAAKSRPEREMCGSVVYRFAQTRSGGDWSALRWLGESTASPEPLTPCKLPPDSAGAWRDLAKQARAAFTGVAAAGAHFVVVPGAAWTRGRSAGGVEERLIAIRVYSKTFREEANACGSFGAVACEAAGSKTVLALNYMRYRLDEAKRLHDTDCQVATFSAVATARGLRKFHAALVRDDAWTPGLTYRTRWDGDLDEPAVWKLVDQLEHEAAALHAQCGGASPLVTALPDGDRGTSPELYMVPSVPAAGASR